MFIVIDFESEVPIYLQLKNEIIKGIASGKLLPGERLPSVRQMASDLGINLHTVNKAYSILRADGYIVMNKRRGVIVAERTRMVDDSFAAILQQSLEAPIAEAICRGLGKQKLVKIVGNLYDQFVGGR